METEWTELKIDNLPSDILTGDYEFLSPCGGPGSGILGIIGEMLDGEECFYRKCQPKAPSHKEIMTKWWKSDRSWRWFKIVQYHNGMYYTEIDDQRFLRKTDFTNFKSADIPPEDK